MMEAPREELPPDPEPVPTSGDVSGSSDAAAAVPAPEPAPIGIVLSRDLAFTAKVRGTAAELGYSMRVAGDVFLARTQIQKWRPRVVFIDLSAGDLVAPQALRVYKQIAGPATWFVAAGPHVQADLLDAARTAGCQVAMPRSRFANELPTLIQRYFSKPVDQGDSTKPPA